ncbi:DUF4139 domain-containing protein [Sphingosinicella rhizophila]|uniref:DUF4139 domain-containing protein n=1 Tax=Sphingosinicella rhizophila TaxID=3050082 RepID=A0ABU3QC97_9SPHN|nr:hypothetical protein [Sphingosinicella sp. GR2756]MDT9600902.1 hypothetical protein [Sphingosinicella sp. GR2756]
MRRALLPLLMLLPSGAAGQVVTTSSGPDAVSVTIYRDPNRDGSQKMQLSWLNGYALISETRRVDIPAGDGDIRFEGVAGGILPESAIVTGLPDGVIEKNQDAYLLSPASLLDRSIGRRVHLRRTSRATGEVREHEAVIRSGAAGAVILQTEQGLEALRCTGIPETIVYDKIPEGLSAKPTLSVRTRSVAAATATITLSYLATGFDWQANYVGNLSPSGDRLDLFAWVTLASGDETSFVDASAQTVAGRPNREDGGRRIMPQASPLSLQCWPAGKTSDIPLVQTHDGAGPPPPAPPPMASPMMAEEIVVTGMSRSAMKVTQEGLGDLKLYRVPEPVTVASNSQKQVAMIDREKVKVESVYRAEIHGGAEERLVQIRMILRTRNRTSEGLGLPLPTGGVAIFVEGRARPILLGEGAIEDKAVGEDVEIELGDASGVLAHVVKTEERKQGSSFLLTASNDQDRPVRFEADFGKDIVAAGKALGRRNGRPLWAVTIPANGRVALRYRTDPTRDR